MVTKKNTMKTRTNIKSVKGLPVQPMQVVVENTSTPAAASEAPAAPTPAAPAPKQAARVLPFVNFQQREENRALATQEVLDLLRKWLPAQYELAEVIGKWVWLSFPEAPAETVRAQLSQFGFHWNNTRESWQHPCGQFVTQGSGKDPRQTYGSRFAADQRAA